MECLKKKLNELKLSQHRSKKYRVKRKQKLDALEQATRKKVTWKGTSKLGHSQKVDNGELIKSICRFAIPGSDAHERKQNEVIKTVRTLEQLTEELNHEGYDVKRSSVYLHLLPRNYRTFANSRGLETSSYNTCKALQISRFQKFISYFHKLRTSQH